MIQGPGDVVRLVVIVAVLGAIGFIFTVAVMLAEQVFPL